MSNEPFYNLDDPTDPIRPPSSAQQDQQGNKLVIGSFKDAQQRPERRPYQYPPPAQDYRNQPTQYPPPQQYGDQPTQYPQRQSVPPNQQVPPRSMPAPAVNPNAPQYPYHRPGQLAGGPPPT